MLNPILVAEDSELCRRVAARQLTHLGYTFHTCANGKEALELLSRRAYSVILMDLQMPIMDGLETTKAIRESELKTHVQRIPIIAITANPDRDRCLKAGMDDFVSKPVTLEKLRDVLERWLLPVQSTEAESYDIEPIHIPELGSWKVVQGETGLDDTFSPKQ